MSKDTIKWSIRNASFKTIIFDLNGTITNSVSKDPRHILYRNNYIESKIKTPVKQNLPNTTSKALGLYGLDVEEYYKYRNSHIDWTLFHRYSNDTFNVFTKFAELGYCLVLYTDCYKEQINPTLKILGVENFFKLIVSKEDGFKKPSSNAYQYIADKLNVKIEELLMIANDFNQDLKRLKDMGGSTIWIKSENYLKETEIIISHHHNISNHIFETKKLSHQ